MSKLFGEPWCTVKIDQTTAKRRKATIVAWAPLHLSVTIGSSKLASIESKDERDQLIRKLVGKAVAKLAPQIREKRDRIDTMLTFMFASSTLLWPVSLLLGGIIDVVLVTALYVNARVSTTNEQFISELMSNTMATDTKPGRQEGQR